MVRAGILLSWLVLIGAGCAASRPSQNSAHTGKLPFTQADDYAGPAMPRNSITVIAHRGLHRDLPENSKEAMVAAWKAGVPWCECDVYLSADGTAFLMHDAKLERTTEAKGRAATRTWPELRALRLKNPEGSLSACTVPALEDVLAVMPADCRLLIEVKPADNAALVGEVLRVSRGRRVVVQSFDEANVRHAMRLTKDVPAALLVDKTERLDAAMNGHWPQVNIDFKLLDDEVVSRARAAGKTLGVWTVDKPADIRRVLDAGAARIITNYPERVHEKAN